MKIEIGESILYSWLKHIKECQIVQLNWKASNKWELKNKEKLEELMKLSSEHFFQKYGYNLYKGTKSLNQLIGQAEIDVLGINYEHEGRSQIFAVDVAFHEAGLNYGSREETVTRVIKKLLRSAMCIYGYFDIHDGTVVFASPKITPSVERDLMNSIDDIEFVLKENHLDYEVRIIGNENFSEKILEPVLNIREEVADTSELFMRSLQLYNLFVGKTSNSVKRTPAEQVTPYREVIKSKGIKGLEEMKIGVIVRTILRKILEEGKVPRNEIELMQTKEYSKETFHIQYPLLQKASITNGKRPERYYATPITINGEEYFLCSEWYEVPENNDRPYLMKWLVQYME